MPPLVFTPESIQMWIGIATAIVQGGEKVVTNFKQFLVDHGIQHDNAILDAQILDDDAKIAEEKKKRDS